MSILQYQSFIGALQPILFFQPRLVSIASLAVTLEHISLPTYPSQLLGNHEVLRKMVQ